MNKSDNDNGYDGPLDLQDLVDQADGEKRFALVLGGMMIAILQEQSRMNFSDAEVSSALALDEDGNIDTRMYATWGERLRRYRDLLGIEHPDATTDEEER